MATRLEKIFRTNTLRLMDYILNEINVLVEQEKNYRSASQQKLNASVELAPADAAKISREELDREWARALANITRSICGFYDKNNITNEEIRIATDRKNKNG